MLICLFRFFVTQAMVIQQNGVTGVPGSELLAYAKSPRLFCQKTGATPPLWSRAITAWNHLRTGPKQWKAKFISQSTSSIKEQLQCGSCWALAAMGSLEVTLMKAGLFNGPLSVQQIIDCVHAPRFPDSNGCSGGSVRSGAT